MMPIAFVAALATLQTAPLETVPWDEVGGLFGLYDRPQYKAKERPAKVILAWRVGDRWTVDVYTREMSAKRSGPNWSEVPQTYEYEVTAVESPRTTIAIHRQGRLVTTATVTLSDSGAEVIGAGEAPLDLPGPQACGRAFESPLGLPYHAKVFSESRVIAFPETAIPKSSRNVVDTDFTRRDGTRVFQRWDMTVPVFPLCSFTLDRVVLLRAVTRAK